MRTKLFLHLTISALSACGPGSGQNTASEEPCVRLAQVTSTGLSASCRAGYIFQGQNMGVISMTHDLVLGRGCDTLKGSATSSRMGNIAIDVNESTQDVMLAYKPGLLKLTPAAATKDSVYVTSSSAADPRTTQQLVTCPGLDDYIVKLSQDAGQLYGQGCSQPNGKSVAMGSFQCPALDRLAQMLPVTKVISTDPLAQAQAGAAHILAGSMAKTMMKNGSGKRLEVLVPIIMMMNMMQNMMQAANFNNKYETGGGFMPNPGDPMPDDAGGAYNGQYRR